MDALREQGGAMIRTFDLVLRQEWRSTVLDVTLYRAITRCTLGLLTNHSSHPELKHPTVNSLALDDRARKHSRENGGDVHERRSRAQGHGPTGSRVAGEPWNGQRVALHVACRSSVVPIALVCIG
jgi:hypothetical protein